MAGELRTLNTGEGDVVITFENETDDLIIERAVAMLQDMQKRGYAILVKQPDGTWARAKGIHGGHKTYMVDLTDPDPTDPSTTPTPSSASTDPAPGRRGRRARTVEQPIATSEAVGVARSAGG